ncbi:MAG: glycine dehydrogenase [Halieaceae bacterium]|jgi:glycine dehydrogenase
MGVKTLHNRRQLDELEHPGEFAHRHIGPSVSDQQAMLNTLGLDSFEQLLDKIVPASIRDDRPLQLRAGVSEQSALDELRTMASGNLVHKSYIGQGYYNSYTPSVILRNVFENPAWYTAYTPYQPEISQGRLEAILNFQTMIVDLTGMELANASMLDEATAAAEAMTLCRRQSRATSQRFFVDRNVLPQSLAVLATRAEPLAIELVVGDAWKEYNAEDYFGVMLQYPGVDGEVRDFSEVAETAHQFKNLVVVAADLLALVELEAPGSLGADVVVGSSQRFGIPLGFGGPHAGYMATRDKFKRALPGRLVGVSVDVHGNPAYRLALQTREQHIRREKATSNICTAQVLLAVMAGMYAVYHGAEGLQRISQRVNLLTDILASGLRTLGFSIINQTWFDTLTLDTGAKTAGIHQRARDAGMNLRYIDATTLGVSLDETTTAEDVVALWQAFDASASLQVGELEAEVEPGIPVSLLRSSEILRHPVFTLYHSETEMMRYLRRLADCDIALDRSMISLGSCTMKLNAASEMLPVSWPEFSQIHPLAPEDQVVGYRQLFSELEHMLCEVTGYSAISLQPNAGSQGEYAGLLAIRAYHKSRGEAGRDVCLIPSSAHGTNPASAQMCGMKVVVVNCDELGNVDLEDLRGKAELHGERLAALMVTYPSTHGVFEEGITEICDIVHRQGGQVYIDGANMNAMVGVCYPGHFGGDVSHLNLHKTFCIPHGGGGPGVGPIGVAAHLAPFLPATDCNADAPVGLVSAAAGGSASILPISWMYLRMMGADGLRAATLNAILNANYVAARLSAHYPILYTGKEGLVAHECILDLRPIKEATGVDVEDVAKRLIDYGFHSPTMSFPVPGTLMVEPTESESRAELDRFCDAMIEIRHEITAVAQGRVELADSALAHAPHTAQEIAADDWRHSYSRTQAAYPLDWLRDHKYWVPVGRVDNVYGDRNLMCSCPTMADYQEV